MGNVVVDASAVIAFLRRERGFEEVASVIPGAVISAVNFSEIASWLSDAGTQERKIRMTLQGLELECRTFDGEAALAAGVLRRATRRKGLSVGDRACLALARHLALPALTADRSWAELDVGVEVKLIRE